jgi:YfiH family protein
LHWDGDHLAGDLDHGARVLFSTRRGGVSTGPFASLDLGRADPAIPVEDPDAVAENRRRLQQAAAGTTHLRFGHQPHGAVVATDERPREDADGQVTRTPGVGAAILVADCLPVAVAGPGGVAMLHAGWRGLAGGILENGVAQLGDAVTATAIIGPGIGVCCFQVGDEVRAAFADHPDARQGDHLDLKLIARRKLQAAGIPVIEDAGLCTHCDAERFFSHRRDGARTGRQGGVAWLS